MAKKATKAKTKATKKTPEPPKKGAKKTAPKAEVKQETKTEKPLSLSDAVNLDKTPKTSSKKAATPMPGGNTGTGKRQKVEETVVYGPQLHQRYPALTLARIDHLPEGSELRKLFPEAGIEISQDAPGIWQAIHDKDIAVLEKAKKKNMLILPEDTELFIISIPL